ncbi:MAG: lipocalin family protein [Pseudomonadota bacterium]
MTAIIKIIRIGVFVAVAFVCVSCLTASLPKNARLDGNAPSNSDQAASGVRSSGRDILGKWELLYQINDKGDRQNPKDLTKTQIEFTDDGKINFTRLDNEQSDSVKSRQGKYSIDKDQINITDDAGNAVKWPFEIASDSLVISMPEQNKKFHWRRLN